MARTLTLLMLLSCGTVWSRADVLEVPSEFATIQLAIDASTDGDTVLVAPGTYNETIDYRGREISVVSSGGPDVTTIDANGSGPVVLLARGEGSGTLLEGFTLTGGTGRLKGGSTYGGAIVGRDGAPTLRGNVLIDNAATFGGGIAYAGGAPVIENNEIRTNRADDGGGIWIREGAPTLVGNLITGNEIPLDSEGSGSGAGVNAQDVIATIVDNEISFNRKRADSLSGNVGGLLVYGDSGLVEGNRIVNNDVCNIGGASIAGDYLIRGNEIRSNTSNDCLGGEYVGGLLVSGGTLIDNVIIGNESASSGGGVAGDFVLMANCIIAYNTGWSLGAGISASGLVVNCTIVGNFLFQGFEGSGAYGGSDLSIVNSIVWGNHPQNEIDGPPLNGPVVTYSNVRGGYPGEGNIDADPRLAAHLQLLLDSPCVDVGTDAIAELPTTDIDGDPRIVDGGSGLLPDMGADEMRPEIAVRYGNLLDVLFPDSVSFSDDVLTINGSIGDRERVVSVAEGEAIVIDLELPATGGNGRYVIHGNLGAPTLGSLTPLPFGIGTIGFPFIVSAGATPDVVWNTIGKEIHAGSDMYFGAPIPDPSPAPTTLLDLPSGDLVHLPTGTLLTVQGVMLDPQAQSSRGASVTNAVVLHIE